MGVPQSCALPIVRQPFPNELVSSWLGRVATLYGCSWPALFKSNFPRPPSIRDYKADANQAAFLSRATRVEAEAIRRLDLFCQFPKQPVRRFICRADTKLAAPDFCGLCFYEDRLEGRDNYFRHEWALAGVSHCHIHQKRLHSGCDNSDCYGNEDLRMCLIEGLVRIVCARCCTVPGMKWSCSQSAMTTKVMHFEARMLKALRRAGNCQPPFKVIDDLAFLFFYSARSRVYSGRKSTLMETAPPSVRLTGPIRKEGRVWDASAVYPLTSLRVFGRLYLMVAVLGAVQGAEIPTPYECRDYARDFSISLRNLFLQLDDKGREEMAFRQTRGPGIYANRFKTS